MLIALLYALVYIACIVMVALIVVWAIEQIAGQPIPARIKQVGMVILILACLIVLVAVIPLPPFPAYPSRGR
jgi:hypothetical protein